MIDPNLIIKIEETINDAKNSEQRTAVWRGKLNESDEFDWKIIVDGRYNENEDDYLIRVVKR